MKKNTNKFIIILLTILLVILLSFGACFRFKMVSADSNITNPNPYYNILVPVIPFDNAQCISSSSLISYYFTLPTSFPSSRMLGDSGSYYYHDGFNDFLTFEAELFSNNTKVNYWCEPGIDYYGGEIYISASNFTFDSDLLRQPLYDLTVYKRNIEDYAPLGLVYIQISGWLADGSYHIFDPIYLNSNATEVLIDGKLLSLNYIDNLRYIDQFIIFTEQESDDFFKFGITQSIMSVYDVANVLKSSPGSTNTVYVYEVDWFESIVDSVDTVMSIEILPEISFYDILIVCVCIPLLVAILKAWLGG